MQCIWFENGDAVYNDWWNFCLEVKRGVTIKVLGICLSASSDNVPFNDAEVVKCPILSCSTRPLGNSKTNESQSKLGDQVDSNVKEADVINSVDISLPDTLLATSNHPKQRVYIGRMSLQPIKPEMFQVLPHHIAIHNVFREDDMAYWTVTWPSEPGFECWEVYQGDNVWIGTALTNAFRDKGPDVPQNGASYHVYGYLGI